MCRNTAFLFFFPSRGNLPRVANDPVFNYAFSANPSRTCRKQPDSSIVRGWKNPGNTLCSVPFLSKRILRAHFRIPLKGTNGRVGEGSRYRNSTPGAVNERHGFSINVFSVVAS
ncbi:hypothetical protein CEXT_566481 [Caerostris extrusa]|uniref:Secreted protein n=1 Tax=Caerostris extrusa TaxID=172846 RepID=A0AAV4UMW8_CAEEX|nr:hypothetical protein CEXT_566481 [Caerostris extrusa]